MIPFWYPQSIDLGFIEFHVFGIMVGIGVLSGSWLAQRRAEELDLNPRVLADLALWVVVIGFIFAHLVSVIFYFPERIVGDACAVASDCLIDGEQFVCRANGRCDNGSLFSLIEIWNGISSFGGFLGAVIALTTFFRFEKIPVIPGLLVLEGGKGRPAMKYVECIAYGFAMGWFWGRMGCFSAHDHVGVVSDSFLAVNFPDDWRSGVPNDPLVGEPGHTPRMDLGLMEVYWSAAMFAWFHFWARKRTLRPGWYTAMMCIMYAPYRFWLDTLRATDIGTPDTRYLADTFPPGITPGQIGAVLVLLLGIGIWVWGGKRMKNEEYMAWTDPLPPEDAPVKA